MGIYVGVNGTPKEVTAVYVGVNGVPKECSDIYVGVNGTPKSCYSGVKPGETIFTSSTTFTVPKKITKIDCFCVGGGGSGSNYLNGSDAFNSTKSGGYGGSGGYTTTVLASSVTPGQVIPIVVGAGGTSGMFASNVTSGSSSSIGSICSANGGCSGYKATDYVRTSNFSLDEIPIAGGSAGGLAYWKYNYYDGSNSSSLWNAGTNGSSDGGTSSSIMHGSGADSSFSAKDCILKGQGTTTRYFGESNGTLYAGGGGGGFYAINSDATALLGGAGGGGNGNTKWGAGCDTGEDGKINTGGGGGGGADGYINISNGGSGVCIIRWSGK